MTVSPYIGLRAFDREHTEYFFGRDRLVRGLLVRLRQTRFIGVLGLSGEGKSSLVRAGLIPALEAGQLDWDGARWDVATLRPDVNPLERLCGALMESQFGRTYAKAFPQGSLIDTLRKRPSELAVLAHSGSGRAKSRLLIVVDQFEELFTRTGNRTPEQQSDADAFVRVLLESTRQGDRVYVMATMRSEHIGECANYEQLAEAMTNGVFLVTRMTSEELREAIELPARLAGGHVESPLTDLLVEKVRGKAQLPVLQHTLMRMWEYATEKNDGRGPVSLTLESFKDHFDSKGDGERQGETGIGKALDEHLEEVFSDLSREEQIAAEVLFRRITKQTTRDDQTGEYRYVREPTRFSDILMVLLTDDTDSDLKRDHLVKTIETFLAPGRTFLAPIQGAIGDDSVIDVTHEAVINHWGRAREWAATEGDLARNLEDLCLRARDQSSILLNAEELERFSAWREGGALWRGGPPMSSAWARRYGAAKPYIDLEKADAFLTKSKEKDDRAKLLNALIQGDIAEAEPLLEKNVRLRDELRGWDFAPHYYALTPDAIRGALKAGRATRAMDPEISQGSLSKQQLEHVFGDTLGDSLKRTTLRQFSIEHFAAYGGDVDVLNYLKQLGFDFKALTEKKSTPFDLAAFGGRFDAMKWLHEKLADPAVTVSHCNVEGVTPLHWLVQSTTRQTERALTSKTSTPPADNSEVVTWLITQGANVNAANTSGETALHWASQIDAPWLVQSLVSNRANLNVANNNGTTPLHYAVERSGREKVRTKLLELGADLNARNKLGQTPLLIAALNQDLGAVVELLERDAKVNDEDVNGLTPLLACLGNNYGSATGRIVEALLKAGADPNLGQDVNGHSALHLAVERDGYRLDGSTLAERLCNAGADLNARNRRGLTPFGLALSRRRSSMASWLISRAGRDKKLNDGWMRTACQYGSSLSVRRLLAAGLSATAKDDAGETPLHIAAAAGQVETLEDLIAAGAALDVVDNEGVTPLRRAIMRDEPEAAVFLASKRATAPLGLKIDPANSENAITPIPQDQILAQLSRQLEQGSANADWPIMPIMTGDWRAATPQEARDALAPLVGDADFLASTPLEGLDALRVRPLICIREGRLFEGRIMLGGVFLGYLTILTYAGGAHALEGEAPTDDDEVEAALSIDSEAAAKEYVQLFFGAKLMDRALLWLVETPEDAAPNARDRMTPAQTEEVAKHAQPLSLRAPEPAEADTKWTGSCTAQYGSELWRISIDISPRGIFRLSGDPLVVDLPLARWTFSGAVRRVIAPTAPMSDPVSDPA